MKTIEIPATSASSTPGDTAEDDSFQIRSQAWQDMIEACGRMCQILGLPRSTGQIFGLLYFSSKPLSLDRMAKLLGISKGSASMGTRQLAAWGAVRKVWVRGQRRDYYEAISDLGNLIRGSYNNLIKPRFTSSRERLDRLRQNLEKDIQSGAISSEESELLRTRLQTLEKLQRKASQILPLAEKLIN